MHQRYDIWSPKTNVLANVLQFFFIEVTNKHRFQGVCKKINTPVDAS